MPTKFFGSLRPKFFAGKTWYPLLYMKFFDTPTFLKHWTDAHKNLRHCETTNFCRKDVIHPVMHEIFRYPKFSETLDGCPRNFAALWDQNFSPEERNNVYYTWNISIPQLLWKIERMLTENLGTVRPKVFAERTWYLLLCIKIFDTPNFLKHWRDAHKKFRHCETKKFQLKNAISLTMHKFYSWPPNYLNHWRDAHKNFRLSETEIFCGKNVISFIIHETFRYPNFSETLNGCPQKI